ARTTRYVATRHAVAILIEVGINSRHVTGRIEYRVGDAAGKPQDTGKLPAPKYGSHRTRLPLVKRKLIHVIDDQVVASCPICRAEIVPEIVSVHRIRVEVGPVVKGVRVSVGDAKLQSLVEAPLDADLQSIVSGVRVHQCRCKASE